MEVNASGKHTSLLRYGNNYCRKKLYSTGPWYHHGVTKQGKTLEVSQNIRLLKNFLHLNTLAYFSEATYAEKSFVQNYLFGSVPKYLTDQKLSTYKHSSLFCWSIKYCEKHCIILVIWSCPKILDFTKFSTYKHSSLFWWSCTEKNCVTLEGSQNIFLAKSFLLGNTLAYFGEASCTEKKLYNFGGVSKY